MTTLRDIAADLRAHAARNIVPEPTEAHAWRPPKSSGDLVIVLWCSEPGAWHLSISRRNLPPGERELSIFLAAFDVPQGIEMERAMHGAWHVRRVVWHETVLVRRAPRKVTIPIEELL